MRLNGCAAVGCGVPFLLLAALLARDAVLNRVRYDAKEPPEPVRQLRVGMDEAATKRLMGEPLDRRPVPCDNEGHPCVALDWSWPLAHGSLRSIGVFRNGVLDMALVTADYGHDEFIYVSGGMTDFELTESGWIRRPI